MKAFSVFFVAIFFYEYQAQRGASPDLAKAVNKQQQDHVEGCLEARFGKVAKSYEIYTGHFHLHGPHNHAS